MRHTRKAMGTTPDGKKDVGFYEFLKSMCEPGAVRKSDLCRYCYEKMPILEDPDDKDAIYCSKTCGISHALASLNGDEFGGQTVEPVEEEEEVKESPRPETPEESEPGEENEEKSASSRLCLRLVELGGDDDLTIENLLATIEDDDEDSFEDSEPRSSGSHRFSSARRDSGVVDYQRPRLDLFKHAIRRSLAISIGDHSAIRESTIEADCTPSLMSPLEDAEQETPDAPTSSTGVAQDEVNVPTGEPKNEPNTELDRSQSFGLASRLRRALNRFSSISKRNSQPNQTPESLKKVGIIKAPERPARPHFATQGPSGDDWNDFVNILQFMEKTGLGGSTEKPSW